MRLNLVFEVNTDWRGRKLQTRDVRVSTPECVTETLLASISISGERLSRDHVVGGLWRFLERFRFVRSVLGKALAYR